MSFLGERARFNPFDYGVHLHRSFDAEVVILSAGSRSELLARGDDLRQVLANGQDLALIDLAYTLNCPPQGRESQDAAGVRLSIVATSTADLERKLARALRRLADPGCAQIEERAGVYYTDTPLHAPGALAFLFPGQGAQYPNMLADLCVHFPEVRAWFDLMDRVFTLAERGRLPSQVIFPPLGGSPAADPATLWALDCGVAAVCAGNQALYSLLSRLAIQPHAVLGHSMGDFCALWASGAVRVDEAEVVRQALLIHEMFERLRSEGRIPTGMLLAIGNLERERVLALVQRSGGALTVAMDNCPHQIVLGGSDDAVAAVTEELQRAGAVCTPLPFDYPSHTPHFAEFTNRMYKLYGQIEGWPDLELSQIAMYSCVTAARCPNDPESVRRLMADQWSQTVRFREAIEAMYADGARIFVEAGPRGSLAAFVDDILRGKPHLAVPANVADRSGVLQLAHLVGLLAAHHVPMDLEPLYAHRSPRRLWTEDGWAPARSDADDPSMRLAVDLPLLKLDRPAQLRPHAMASAPAPGAGAGAGEHVMQAYLDTMDRFLEVQRQTMRALLSAGGETAPSCENGSGDALAPGSLWESNHQPHGTLASAPAPAPALREPLSHPPQQWT